MTVYSVTQVTHYLKQSLERDLLLGDLWITGEVSNLTTARSGHSYFTIKDAQSQLRSVMFSGGRGAELLMEGGQVTAHGRISLYEARGDVQLIADLVMPEGTGALTLELERLKLRLEEEGLFEPSRKRPLPQFPRVIGLVTSPTGAVLDDIRNVLGRRYPLAELLLSPTQVQGDDAANQIVAALRALNEDGRSDVIVLARGGGTLEELWPFNEEVVARAIYASHIPVVSAIGHERDYTVADYVADMRAPTPSAAAELVTPNRAQLDQAVRDLRAGLGMEMSRCLSSRRQDLERLRRHLNVCAPDVDTYRHRVDDMAKAGHLAMSNVLSLWRERVSGLGMGLQALDPGSILQRGYSIVQKQTGGDVVSKTAQATSGDQLKVTVSDGAFPATVGGTGKKTRRRQVPQPAGARLL